MRIVSLLPSATEILFALGLDHEIVGVSHECAYPPQAKTKRAVIHSRLPHGASPAEIDRLVSEYVHRGESLYAVDRSEEHTSELQSHHDLVCRLLLEKKKFYSRQIHEHIHTSNYRTDLHTLLCV